MDKVWNLSDICFYKRYTIHQKLASQNVLNPLHLLRGKYSNKYTTNIQQSFRLDKIMSKHPQTWMTNLSIFPLHSELSIRFLLNVHRHTLVQELDASVLHFVCEQLCHLLVKAPQHHWPHHHCCVKSHCLKEPSTLQSDIWQLQSRN